MIRIKCPKCATILSLDDAQSGEITTCVSCQAKLRVPQRRPAPSPTAAPPAPSPDIKAAPPAPRPSRVNVPPPDDDEDIPTVGAADDEDDADDNPDASGGRGRFAVRPFKPDGGFAPLGLVILPLFSLLAAVILGALASFIGQWFYLIILFPIGIGFLVGLAGLAGGRLGKVRNVWLAGLVGLLAGLVAMFTYHFCDYLRLRSTLADLPPELVRQMNDPAVRFRRGGAQPLPPGVAEEIRQAAQVTSFPSYLNYAATQGVSIGRAGRAGDGMNLGYIGTWIYWIVEVAIVAVIAFLCCMGGAATPFCRACNNWKKDQKIGHLDMDNEEAKKQLEAGRLERLAFADHRTGLRLKACACPECGKDSDVELILETVEMTGKNQEKTNEALKVTAAGAALGYLRRRAAEAEEEAERERQRERARRRDDDEDEE